MTAPKVGFISLGCPKALVDSERILTQLKTDGYDVVNTYDDAQIVVINTCGFIDSAIEESLDAIGEAIDETGKVIVTGCLGEKADLIKAQYPQVLEVTGAHAYDDVVSAINKHAPIEKGHNPHIDLIPPQGIKLTPKHYAYLKISEGCNHRCSFCIIPSLRGDLVSRPIGEVMTEAENLVNAGVKELLVISQDTSAYGVDTKYKTDFWGGRPLKTKMYDLCKALSDLGIWTRLHYVYPYPHVDDIIPLMAEGKVLPYLDIPFQHANYDILKSMKRPAAAQDTLDRVKAWRKACPDLALRSTFIVGYPGETESQFEELLDFISEAQLDRVGAFAYSPVDGATANELPNQIPEEVKQDRLDRLMTHQANISLDQLAKKVGTTQTILIDEIASDGAVGRTKGDAPEIDGVVLVENYGNLKPGDMVDVKITANDHYDLAGELLQ